MFNNYDCMIWLVLYLYIHLFDVNMRLVLKCIW